MANRFSWLFREIQTTPELPYQVVFIDGTTRKKYDLESSNLRVRNHGLYPKTKDLMQVTRYGVMSTESVYTPVRIATDSIFSDDFKVCVDLTDWQILQIRRWGERYNAFLSTVDVSGTVFEEAKRREESLVKEGIDYELLLLDSRGKLIRREGMHKTIESPWTLYGYEQGYAPDIDALSGFSLSKEVIMGRALVEAVLHPLVGVPLVLLRQRKGENIG